MKIGIIGQKWLGERLFEQLVHRYDIGFVAAPDEDDRLARAALEAGLTPTYYGGGAGLDLPAGTKLDLLITAHAFIHIPASARARASWSIGYHPSLLPLHRGRKAVEAAIAGGDRITGGTVYHLDDGFDTGEVAFQDWCFVRKRETAAELWRRALAPLGLDLLMKAVNHLDNHGALPSARQQAIE